MLLRQFAYDIKDINLRKGVKQMFRRIISGLLVLSMLLSINIPVFAVDGDNGNDNIIEIEMVDFKIGWIVFLI